jgi:hypothetical protein
VNGDPSKGLVVGLIITMFNLLMCLAGGILYLYEGLKETRFQ